MSETMRVELKNRDAKSIVVMVSGSVDGESHAKFSAAVEAAVNQKPSKVLVDLSDCTYVSSSGIGAFFEFRRDARANGGGLIFLNLQPQIKKVFEVIKALPLDCVFTSMEEADLYLDRIMLEELQKQKDQDN